jgi:hypothetical protein
MKTMETKLYRHKVTYLILFMKEINSTCLSRASNIYVCSFTTLLDRTCIKDDTVAYNKSLVFYYLLMSRCGAIFMYFELKKDWNYYVSFRSSIRE